LGAIIIGSVAAAVVVFGVDLIEHLRIDDPIGAVAVHGFCGIFGTLSIGLFATGQFGVPGATGADTSSTVTGLFYGGGLDQLKSQLIGSVFVVIVCLVVGCALMYGIKATGTLRISEAGELEGIDRHEHGAPAYHPEPAYTGIAPTGSIESSARSPRTVSAKV
jgi:Amt family ammonium transporter